MDWSKEIGNDLIVKTLKKVAKNNSNSLSVTLSLLKSKARNLAFLKHLALAVLVLLISFGLLFLMDRLIDSPIWFRCTLFISSSLALLYLGSRFWIHAFILPKSPSWLARKIKVVFGDVGDRLLGIIQLSDSIDSEESNYSQSLILAAREKVKIEISGLPLGETFSLKSLRPLTKSLSIVSILTVSFFLFFPSLAQNSFKRWFFPWENIPRETLTKLNHFPETWIFPKKEVSRFRLELSNDSKLSPRKATLLGDKRFYLKAKNNNNSFEFIVPGLLKEQKVELSVGDLRKSIKLKPIERPTIKDLESVAQYPDYLNYQPKSVSPLNNTFKIPHGTAIKIQGNTSRFLSSFHVTSQEIEPRSSFFKDSFSIQLSPLIQNASLDIKLLDCFGISPTKPNQLVFIPVSDEEPNVEFPDLPQKVTILINETIPIRIIASDDHSISRLQLNLERQSKIENNSTDVLFDKDFDSSNKVGEFTLPFDPAIFNLKNGDRLEFFAKAWDRKPNRAPTISGKLSIEVIGLEEHAEQLRGEFEKIMARTSEIAREQENIFLKTTALKDAINRHNIKVSSHNMSALNELARLQDENKIGLKDVAHIGIGKLNEALRNPVFKIEILESIWENIRKMNEVADKPLTDSSELITTAISASIQSSSNLLREAKKSQTEALAKLAEILSSGSNQMDELEALTIAQRLREIEKNENKVSMNLLQLLPQSIGHTSKDLNPDLVKKNARLEKLQNVTHEKADLLEDEISRYYERTGKFVYGKISQAMEKEKTVEQILKVSQRIKDNLSFRALGNLEILIKKFNEWVYLLEKSDPSSKSGEGSSLQNSQTKDIKKVILSLLKIRRDQIDVFKKTKVLQNQSLLAKKNSWISNLKKIQEKLMVDLTDTQIETAEENLNPIFDDAHSSMSSSAVNLSKCIFDETTTSAQKDARNNISDLINLLIESVVSSSSGQNKIKPEMSNLDFLLMEMKSSGGEQSGKMLPGSSGGGSSHGGTMNKDIQASDQGAAFESPSIRNKTKSTGGTPNPIPSEFKEIMDRYFKVISD